MLQYKNFLVELFARKSCSKTAGFKILAWTLVYQFSSILIIILQKKERNASHKVGSMGTSGPSLATGAV